LYYTLHDSYFLLRSLALRFVLLVCTDATVSTCASIIWFTTTSNNQTKVEAATRADVDLGGWGEGATGHIM